MSSQDQPPGPGYWKASDDNWYPPEQHPDYRPPAAPAPPPQQAYQPPAGPPTGPPMGQQQQRAPQSRAEAKADAKAAAARAKAMRPWYKKKRVMIPLVLVAIIGISVAASGGGDDDKTASNNSSGDDGGSSDNPNSSEADIFPNRPDEKDGDKEREIGGAADLSGYTITVTAAQRKQELSQFEDAGYIVAQATLLNRDDSAQSYNTFDWKLITPNGTIIDPCLCSDQLGSGDLANGGTISGQLVWEVGDTKGDYYIVFDPSDLSNENRAVWKLTVQ